MERVGVGQTICCSCVTEISGLAEACRYPLFRPVISDLLNRIEVNISKYYLQIPFWVGWIKKGKKNLSDQKEFTEVRPNDFDESVSRLPMQLLWFNLETG